MTTNSVLLRSELPQLLDHRAEWCVSLFQPTHRAGAEVEQDPIRLKNLLRTAEDRLVEHGMRRTLARDLLAPAHGLVPQVDYWQHQGDGLALYLAPGFFREFRLPLPLHELVVVSDRFELQPILPLFLSDGRYYVLALSQKQNRLIMATREGVRQLETPGVPPSLAAALRFDDPERQLQYHSRTGGAPARQGRRAAIYHGHGVGVDDAKTNVLRYCQKVDRGLHEVLRDEHAPLVLAAVEFEQAIYREANTYPHLLPRGVSGNPDLAAAEELARAAWNVVEPHFRAEQDAAAQTFRSLQGTDRAATTLETVLPAAVQGRVDTLFTVRGTHVWGRFDPTSLALELANDGGPAAGHHDLLDDAARLTLRRGGRVYVVDRESMPAAGHVAAVFRF